MQLLHVTASLTAEWGGPPRVVAALTEALGRRDIRCAIFTPIHSQTRQLIIQPGGTEVCVFPCGWLARWWTGYSPALNAALLERVREFDVIHVHEFWHYPHFAGCRAAMRWNKPYVITIHGGLQPWALNHKSIRKRVYMKLVQRRILERASAVHAVTGTEIHHLQRLGLGSRVTLIPNGIDAREFQCLPPRREFEERYPEVAGKPIILFLGRIHPIKGLDLLARAFGRLARERTNVRLVIAGPDANGHRVKVEGILAAEGARDLTIFPGMLHGREKLAALARADVLVLPSRSEIRSIVALEAMACRVPVVLTRQCDFPEVAEANAGEIVEPEPGQLAEALKGLLDNPDLRRRMGENGRRMVLERYTWDQIADEMAALYEMVLGRSSPPRPVGAA